MIESIEYLFYEFLRIADNVGRLLLVYKGNKYAMYYSSVSNVFLIYTQRRLSIVIFDSICKLQTLRKGNVLIKFPEHSKETQNWKSCYFKFEKRKYY